MYIEPNTEVRLLSNVPLDKKYEHTVYFSSLKKQQNTFLDYTKHILTKQSYQRVNVGAYRVNLLADHCYDCNYMMFKNTSFGDKWFYAFITKVEYLSNVACTIYYEIDVIQTWLTDIEFKECFVEREHSASDLVGEHILPEPVELGEYMLTDYKKITDKFDEYYVIVGVLPLIDGATYAILYDNIIQGLCYQVYDMSAIGMSKFRSLLDAYKETPDNIIAMYLVPKPLIRVKEYPDDVGSNIYQYLVQGAGDKPYDEIINVDTSEFDSFFGNYLPKNNKLYTYPYTYYHIDNNNGSTLQLRFEFFDDYNNGGIKLAFNGTVNTPVQITCRPVNYKKADKLNTEVISLKNFPMCSWSSDAYTAWVANNELPTMLQMGSSAIMGGIGLATGNSMLTTMSLMQGANTALNYGIGEYQASIAGDKIRGNFHNGNLNSSHKMQTFYHGVAKITEDYARTIDDYFTKFGYRCCKTKKPNINVRENFTFTKTRGCIISGGIPSDDKEKICSIFDCGITFWKNISNIGNYSVDNYTL